MEVSPAIIIKAIVASRNICFLMGSLEMNLLLEQLNKTLKNLQDEEQRRGEIMHNPTFVSQTIQGVINISKALRDSLFASPY